MQFGAIGILALLVATSAAQCDKKLEWSTKNGSVLVNGRPLVLKGIVYKGFETPTFAPEGIENNNLNKTLDLIKENHFNAIRLPISLQLVSDSRDTPYTKNTSIACEQNPELCGTSAVRLLDIFIYRAAERGLLIVLENAQFVASTEYPPPLWYNAEYSEELVMKNWHALISRYRSKWNVFAVNLKTEPNNAATWGNSSLRTDWNKAAERMIKEFHRTDQAYSGLFFVDGIDYGTRLDNAAEYPIDTGNAILNSRVVYTAHCYPPTLLKRSEHEASNFPDNMEAVQMRKYAFLADKGLPMLIGGWSVPDDDADELNNKWTEWMVKWLKRKCLTNNFYWAFDPNKSKKHGLVLESPPNAKQALVNSIQPNPTKFEQQKAQICITHGTFPEAHCESG